MPGCTVQEHFLKMARLAAANDLESVTIEGEWRTDIGAVGGETTGYVIKNPNGAGYICP